MSALVHTQEGELATAFHEAGHAVIGAALGRVIERVDIIPREDSYGSTWRADEEDAACNDPLGTPSRDILLWPERPNGSLEYFISVVCLAAGEVSHRHHHPEIPEYPGTGWELYEAQQDGDGFGLYGNCLVELVEDLLDHHVDDVRRIADLLLVKKEITGEDVGVSRCEACCAVVESIGRASQAAEAVAA